MKSIAKLAVGLTSFVALSAQAYMQYDVTNTSRVNCSGSPHGLWTNNAIGGGSCSNYFSIDGTFTLYNDDADQSNWYATLDADATNPQGATADIDLTFGGFLDDLSGTSYVYKQEGGAPYSAADMDFFTSITGSIDVGTSTYTFNNMVGNHVFQYGLGANAKDPDEFGGSAWIMYNNTKSDHWDLNLTFTPVPEPGTLALFGLGALGLAASRRKAK